MLGSGEEEGRERRRRDKKESRRSGRDDREDDDDRYKKRKKGKHSDRDKGKGWAPKSLQLPVLLFRRHFKDALSKKNIPRMLNRHSFGSHFLKQYAYFCDFEPQRVK